MYTTQQVVFTFAWLAYRGDPLPFGAAQDAKIVLGELKAKIHELKPLDDKWDVAWGPALHQLPFALLSDGMIVVVRSKQDPKRLVIAIRGTNPASVSTWLFQNFLVADTVPWPFGAQPAALKPLISQGTSRGLSTLLDMVPTSGIPGEGVLLLDFLRGEVAARGAVDITLTGHSLGGVLASTLALALADLRKDGAGLADPWDPEERASLTTYSFGAPTAGDRDFATYTDQRIGATLHRVWNTHDVVPYAWNARTLDMVPKIYSRHVFPDPFIEAARLLTTIAVAQVGYTHPGAGEEKFTGSIESGLLFFGAQALHQHGQAYLEFMGLSNMLSVLDVITALEAAQTETYLVLEKGANFVG